MTHPLVLPMLIQMSLSLIILYWLSYGRLTTIKKAGGIAGLRKEGGFNAKLINRGDNFKNQFELPVIFYGLCLLFIVTDSATSAVVNAAWIFVISRILHTVIQASNNKIFPNRFLAFLVGSLALTAMLVMAIMKAV